MHRADQFVFIHMFRMGGTTCMEQVNVTDIGYHLPYSMLPAQLSYLPVIGTIRNPFDWYVSVYQHCKNTAPHMQTGTFLNFMMDFKHSTMEDTLRRLIDPSWMKQKDIDNALQHFPSFYNYDDSKLDNLRKAEFLGYIKSGKGFLSWLFDYMFAINGSVEHMKFCKLEDLARDFKRHTNLDISSSLHLNSFDDAPGCGDILSGELKELIQNKDGDYIKQYYSELLGNKVI